MNTFLLTFLLQIILLFQNTSTIFLKANLEYLRGNYKKAMRLLNSATIENLDFKYVTNVNLFIYKRMGQSLKNL